MSHMQPRVFIANGYEVETTNGTEWVLEDVAGPMAQQDDLEQYVEGEIESFEYKMHQVFGHTTAPGYLDQTDLVAFDSEEEAWEYLVENYPETFTWQVERTSNMPTAYIYAADEKAAMVLKAAIQSINGSLLEQDDAFLYADLSDPEAANKELRDAGFSTNEAA